MDPTTASPTTPRQRTPDYTLDIFADPTFAKDIIKAVLHTIFFHRYFTPIVPVSRDLLDLTLPAIDDVDLETLIDQRASALVRELGSGEGGGLGRGGGYGAGGMGGMSGASRGQLAVQFYEKRRRKGYTFFGKGDEEVCWEQWTLDVTLATPRTETDVIKVRRAMEKSLQKTTMKIIDIVNRDKGHIPPITTTESNPFPYQILVNPKNDGWSQRMGIF
ncbi:DUF1649-domain-containing protein [Rhizodiscina lignyota]|uniref:Autophagy-related protein 101 n=1 Tax=Rhizodiscina lignyota TaxID=1504668 RepID=A0A9P4M1R9_9PEZI|nr:DUF1649-domain-containing protein [Rhizodiscina lignyota]